MPQICEACERASAEIVEPCDDAQQPYHLCVPCHQRLHETTLRPMEWYNLSKRHGCNRFMLHCDFYDEDGRNPDPVDPSDIPAPTLEAVSHDPDLLLDYSITRWYLRKNLAAAWDTFAPERTLATLSERFAATRNVDVRGRILEVCASALSDSAADFVRDAWSDYPGDALLSPLANASAACLPFREGFDRVLEALNALPDDRKLWLTCCLGAFHSPVVLDWIEEEIFRSTDRFFGGLAASSAFDWPRAERWLALGPPLSHAALRALLSFCQHSPVNGYLPILLLPPTEETLREVLSAYAARDPDPRVQTQVGHILANASNVISATPSVTALSEALIFRKPR